MRPLVLAGLFVFGVLVLSFGFSWARANAQPFVRVPEASVDVPPSGSLQTAVFAGGCFWGVEAVFEDLRGVKEAVSGYAGGGANSARYDVISGGGTQHAEAVQVTFDPAQITYGQLLKIFFAIAHDPTQLNRQGPDQGFQYRSAIFYSSEEQRKAAEAYVVSLGRAKLFESPIVTKITSLPAFYPAESYHQNYLKNHPYEPYIVVNDAPKLKRLRAQFPEMVKTSAIR